MADESHTTIPHHVTIRDGWHEEAKPVSAAEAKRLQAAGEEVIWLRAEPRRQ